LTGCVSLIQKKRPPGHTVERAAIRFHFPPREAEEPPAPWAHQPLTEAENDDLPLLLQITSETLCFNFNPPKKKPTAGKNNRPRQQTAGRTKRAIGNLW